MSEQAIYAVVGVVAVVGWLSGFTMGVIVTGMLAALGRWVFTFSRTKAPAGDQPGREGG